MISALFVTEIDFKKSSKKKEAEPLAEKETAALPVETEEQSS